MPGHVIKLIFSAIPSKLICTNFSCLLQDDIHEEVTREANGLTFQTLNRLTFSAQRELTSLSCFASNKALDERKGVHLVQSTTINVKFKPEVLLSPNKSRIIHAVEGEPLAVTCNFKANPMVGANIKWFKNGHLLENHPNKPGKYCFFTRLLLGYEFLYRRE